LGAGVTFLGAACTFPPAGAFPLLLAEAFPPRAVVNFLVPFAAPAFPAKEGKEKEEKKEKKEEAGVAFVVTFSSH
jgi:hypothetical protein